MRRENTVKWAVSRQSTGKMHYCLENSFFLSRTLSVFPLFSFFREFVKVVLPGFLSCDFFLSKFLVAVPFVVVKFLSGSASQSLFL